MITILSFFLKVIIAAVELTQGNHIFYFHGLTGIPKDKGIIDDIMEQESENKTMILLKK